MRRLCLWPWLAVPTVGSTRLGGLSAPSALSHSSHCRRARRRLPWPADESSKRDRNCHPHTRHRLCATETGQPPGVGRGGFAPVAGRCVCGRPGPPAPRVGCTRTARRQMARRSGAHGSRVQTVSRRQTPADAVTTAHASNRSKRPAPPPARSRIGPGRQTNEIATARSDVCEGAHVPRHPAFRRSSRASEINKRISAFSSLFLLSKPQTCPARREG